MLHTYFVYCQAQIFFSLILKIQRKWDYFLKSEKIHYNDPLIHDDLWYDPLHRFLDAECA